MGNLLEDINSYLVDQEVAVEGATYEDFLPDGPDQVVVCNEYAGFPKPIGATSVTRSVQILTRAASVSLARSMSWSIYGTLCGADSTTQDFILSLTETRWAVISPGQTPFKLRIDALGRTIYACNYNVVTLPD